MSDFESQAKELVNSLPDDMDVDVDEVEDKLRELVDDFNVQMTEAVRSTRNKYMRDYDGDQDVGSSGSSTPQDEDLDIGDLTVDHDEEWFNIRGQVERLFDLNENQAEWIAQRGVIADDTGTTTFTVFNDTVEEDPSTELEVGNSYELLGVVGDAYEGQISIELTKTTTVNEIDEEFSPPDSDTEVTGVIVDVQQGSGLVERCTHDDCTRVLNNGRCAEHGDVDGEFDLRLKTIVDDGEKAHQVFFNKEATEAITGISLDNAIEIAEDAMDTTAVMQEMEPLITGRYYRVAGDNVGEYVIVNEFERVSPDDDEIRERYEAIKQSIETLQSEVSA